MTNATDRLEPGFVRMIHPVHGGIADVHELATGAMFGAGWALLGAPGTEDEGRPEDAPARMTEAQVRSQFEHQQGSAPEGGTGEATTGAASLPPAPDGGDGGTAGTGQTKSQARKAGSGTEE